MAVVALPVVYGFGSGGGESGCVIVVVLVRVIAGVLGSGVSIYHNFLLLRNA